MITGAPHAYPEPAAGSPSAGGIRISGVVCNAFQERREPLAGWSEQSMREILQAGGCEDELESVLSRYGNSFIEMSEDLLRRVGTPLPAADVVFLAYQTPDLFHSDVAGCYLTERFSGSPVPLSITGQGPGAAFSALRVADVMWRLGELRRGALFAYDQNAAMWAEEQEVQSLPDSAVLLLLGPSGGASVGELTEQAAPDPAAVLRQTLGRRPTERALVGRALLDSLGGLASHPSVLPVPRTHLFTSVWMSLARLWPLTEPVLMADFDPCAERLYCCRLVPEAQP